MIDKILNEILTKKADLVCERIEPKVLILGSMSYMYLRSYLVDKAHKEGQFTRNKIDTPELTSKGDTGDIAIKTFEGLRVLNASGAREYIGKVDEADFEVSIYGSPYQTKTKSDE